MRAEKSGTKIKLKAIHVHKTEPRRLRVRTVSRSCTKLYFLETKLYKQSCPHALRVYRAIARGPRTTRGVHRHSGGFTTGEYKPP